MLSWFSLLQIQRNGGSSAATRGPEQIPIRFRLVAVYEHQGDDRCRLRQSKRVQRDTWRALRKKRAGRQPERSGKGSALRRGSGYPSKMDGRDDVASWIMSPLYHKHKRWAMPETYCVAVTTAAR